MELLDLLMEKRNMIEFEGSCNYLKVPVWGGWSPITFQFYVLNSEMLSFLINLNIEFDVNQELPNKFTALTWAIFKGDKTMLEFLLSQGNIDPQRKDGWKSDPVSFAQNMNRQAMADLLNYHYNTKSSTSTFFSINENQQEIWAKTL